ncbi:MAG: DNA recombination protein RmuC [Pirellulales bacterium]|jgi:DNA recombination protein RmuC|nr:DNA recombination protein RmuC [Pirellulales bacterium]
MVDTLLLIAILLLLLVVLAFLAKSKNGGSSSANEAFNHRFDAAERSHERLERNVLEQIGKNRTELLTATREGRKELSESVKVFGDTLNNRLTQLTNANDQKLEKIRETVESKLTALQQDNTKALEKVRSTVDEKLQGTLEKRLGESFKLISDRLEKVHQGLGEMQSLASGVGDLKRVLTNVKVRGTWGEMQLEALLSQVLAPEQFSKNIDTRDSGERVEFVINLPGPRVQGSDVVWLPIDSKFPLEDYRRLVDAHEKADAEAAATATRAIAASIKASARTISEKYIAPPRTTDFGIMYLPIEGLYAEVIQQPDLCELLQREYRVSLAGPTTLAALLNALQMGFRTLAIQQRSSEVWQILSDVKTQFGLFSEVLAKVQKKLTQASSSIDAASTRTRAIERKLKDVEELPISASEDILGISSIEPDEDACRANEPEKPKEASS